MIRTPATVECIGKCKVYWCPQTQEYECPEHGGFAVCCSRPDLHEPLQDTMFTALKDLHKAIHNLWETILNELRKTPARFR